MGVYINVGNAGFQSARNGEYADKSLLIATINETIYTERRFIWVLSANDSKFQNKETQL
jgi:hypothetical protein